MTRLLLLTPFALAACATPPCPIPVSCIEPEWCVCVVTGAVDAVSDDGGAFTAPTRTQSRPDVTDHGPGNGGGSHTSDGNGSSSEGGSDE